MGRKEREEDWEGRTRAITVGEYKGDERGKRRISDGDGFSGWRLGERRWVEGKEEWDRKRKGKREEGERCSGRGIRRGEGGREGVGK